MIVDAIWEAAIRKSVREQMHKVSFGGDRSEAGRYAANQRWKGRTSTEKPAPKSMLSEDQKVAVGKINKAMKYTESKGFRYVVLNGTQVKEIKEAYDNWISQEAKHVEAGEAAGLHGQAYANLIAGHQYIRTSLELINTGAHPSNPKPQPPSEELHLLIDDKGIIAAVANTSSNPLPNPESDGSFRKTMAINYMGSTGIVKGAGSALYGNIVKHHAQNKGFSVSMDIADTGFQFWIKMGLKVQTYGGRIASGSLLDVDEFAKEIA